MAAPRSPSPGPGTPEAAGPGTVVVTGISGNLGRAHNFQEFLDLARKFVEWATGKELAARAVAGEVKSQAALDEVAKQWNAITDRLGKDQQKKLYRQMLGLPTQ